LRDADVAVLAHLGFPLLLLVEQLPFPARIPAIAFRRDVLAHRADRFARDDLAADRGLDGDFVSGGVDPFCPEGFRVGSINYDGNGNITGWQCLNNSDGSSWYGTAAQWVGRIGEAIIKFVGDLL